MSIRIMSDTFTNLRVHFLWPLNGQEFSSPLSYYIKWAIVQILSIVPLLGCVLHLIVSIKIESYNFFEDLYMIIAEIGAYYFLATFVYYQKEIAKICADLSDFETYGKPPTFDSTNRILILLSRFYKRFVDVAVVCFCLPPFFLKGYCLKHNENKEFPEICGIIVTSWMPFDITTFPTNQIFYFWQAFGIIMTLRGAAMISCAICETMEYLLIKIQHVKILLKKCIETEDLELREKRFGQVVRYHSHIFSIGERLDKCYSGSLFLHLLFSGALFGCIAYQLMTAGISLKGVALLSAWFNSLIVVSVSGQRVFDETLSIGDVAYDSKWYERDPKFRRKVMFIIARSRKPVLVHAGPFSYLSHLIILSILKTAYSYLTLLTTTTT